MLDTSDVYAVDSEGRYHKSCCLMLVNDDDPEPISKLPDDARLEDCCRNGTKWRF